jgi:hypothetical protein
MFLIKGKLDTTICVPYRNRATHLALFLENTVPKLPENFHVLIVEQSGDNQLFNRGKLLNIGFTEFKDKTKYFMTHDVDINPTQETIDTLYTKPVDENAVLGIYTSHHNTLGGIVKLRSSTIHKCNGFINEYWGWGAEDKTLQNRCEFYGFSIEKNVLNNDENRHTYFTILNDINDRAKSPDLNPRTQFEYQLFRTLSKERKLQSIKKSGLSNLEYTVLKTNSICENVTHILVKL